MSTPVRVKATIQKAQYSRALFPDMYTDANPMGLYSRSQIDEILAGHGSFNRGTTFWHDLSAFDAEGRELGGNEIRALGLAFRNEHHIFTGGGHTRVIGLGAGENGAPTPGYIMIEEGWAGLGQQAWNDSLGMNVRSRTDAYGEGRIVWRGSFAGIEANELVANVS